MKLSGTADYVNLPASVGTALHGLHDFTISAWVNPPATPTWSRVFDFGTGTSVYMFLTVSAGGGAALRDHDRAAAAASSSSTAPLRFRSNPWTHVAVTLSGTTGTLYINGNAVATNPNMTLHPVEPRRSRRSDWIGRSQFSDPFLNATVDDFQIYSRALTAAEVADPRRRAAGRRRRRLATASTRRAAQPPSTPPATAATRPSSRPSPTDAAPARSSCNGTCQTGNLVCWKDQQNFLPFIEGIPPDTANTRRRCATTPTSAEFPIMPCTPPTRPTRRPATAFGAPGSNNFSNINATLQAQLYAEAIRALPVAVHHPDMYRQMIEWLTWNEDINGNNQLPDNNEFYFNWNPTTQTLSGRASTTTCSARTTG